MFSKPRTRRPRSLRTPTQSPGLTACEQMEDRRLLSGIDPIFTVSTGDFFSQQPEAGNSWTTLIVNQQFGQFTLRAFHAESGERYEAVVPTVLEDGESTRYYGISASLSSDGQYLFVRGRVYGESPALFTKVFDAESLTLDTPATPLFSRRWLGDSYFRSLLELESGFAFEVYHQELQQNQTVVLLPKAESPVQVFSGYLDDSAFQNVIGSPAGSAAAGIIFVQQERFLIERTGVMRNVTHFSLRTHSLVAETSEYWLSYENGSVSDRITVQNKSDGRIASRFYLPSSASYIQGGRIAEDETRVTLAVNAADDAGNAAIDIWTISLEDFSTSVTRILRGSGTGEPLLEAAFTENYVLFQSSQRRTTEVIRLDDLSTVIQLNTNPVGADGYGSPEAVEYGGALWFLSHNHAQQISLFQLTGSGSVTEADFLQRSDGWQYSGLRLLVSKETPVLIIPQSSYQRGRMDLLDSGIYRIEPESVMSAGMPPGPASLQLTPSAEGGQLLRWEELEDADFYHLEASNIGAFSSSLYVGLSGTVQVPRYEIPVRGLGYFFVRVRGVNHDGATTAWTSQLVHDEPVHDDVIGRLAYVLEPNPDREPSQGGYLDIEIGYTRDESLGVAGAANVTLKSVETGRERTAGYASSWEGVREKEWTNAGDFTHFRRNENIYVQSETDASLSLSSQIYWRSFVEDVDSPAALESIGTVLPLNLRDGYPVFAPELVAVDGDSTFTWEGTLTDTESHFVVWVDDLTRSVPRTLLQTTQEESLSTDLLHGHYRAWVGVQDPDGRYSYWSEPTEFQVAGPPLNHGSQSHPVNTQPLFLWSGDPAATFEVYLSNLTTKAKVAQEMISAADRWRPNAELDYGKYAFWVREYSATEGWSAWSDVATTYVRPPAINPTVSDLTVFDRQPLVSWTAADHAGTHQVWVSNAAGRPVYRSVVGATDAHYVTQPLAPGNYTVWVRSDPGTDVATLWGAGAGFTIQGGPVLSANGRTLTWTNEATATHFELWIDYLGGTADRQSRIVHIPLLPNNGQSFQLSDTLSDGNYKAWIRAVRAESGGVRHYSAWSAPLEFSVAEVEANRLSDIETIESSLQATTFEKSLNAEETQTTSPEDHAVTSAEPDWNERPRDVVPETNPAVAIGSADTWSNGSEADRLAKVSQLPAELDGSWAAYEQWANAVL